MGKHKRGRERKVDRAKFLQTLIRKGLNITKACKAHNIARRTFYLWLETDPEFKQMYEDALEAEKDEAEEYHRIIRRGIPILDDNNKILGWIEKPDRQALETFLSRKAKERGWGDKKELDITTDGESLNKPLLVKFEGMDDE